MKDDPEFQRFLKEIDDHFVYVLSELLHWEVEERPQFAVGAGNVVIRFKTRDGRFLFRVPKVSQQQLRRVALAYALFGKTGLMPERIYFDGKCVIERYVEGMALSTRTSDQALVALGRALSQIHAVPGDAYGPLSHGTTGSCADPQEYYGQKPFPPADDGERDEDLTEREERRLGCLSDRASVLPDRLARAPRFLGHGDMWRRNIVIKDDRLKLIDWDRIGSYPREHDFVFMVDADLEQTQKDLLLASYRFELDPELLAWFSLRRVLGNRGIGKREKLALAERHRLLPEQANSGAGL